MSAPAPAFQAGQRVGPWTLVARLGRGGFGEVWRATGERGVVALKLPTHPRVRRHLRTERALLARVEHPGVVAELDADLTASVPWLATEYVAGQNLRQAIAAEPGGFKIAQIVTVSDQLLAALSAIHAAGAVHCDLKPENVLIATDGRVKIIDLGLGRATSEVLAEVHVSLSMVSAGPVEGTLAYMAPEQKWGGEVTPRTDLFAFGVMLFELLTGDLPRGVVKPTDLRPDVSSRFDLILRKALDPVPARRFASAAALSDKIAIVRRERAPVPLPERPPDEAATEVRIADLSALDRASPYRAGDRVGALTLESLLGRGGFGEVWRATRADQPVAVKLPLGQGSRQRLRHEAALAGRLCHRRIPTLLEDRTDVEPPHLVYELIDGVSLRAELNEHHALPLDRALPVIAGLAEALACCHAAGVVHRDLKPDNVLLTADGPVLLDVGLGRLETPARPVEHSLATEAGVVGTYDYMAPEQRRGETVGPAADLYALGLIAFEVLTGAPPAGGASLRDRLPRAPARLESAIAELLADAPARRGAASGWAERLRPEAVRAPASRQIRRARAPRVWRPWLSGALVAFLAFSYLYVNRLPFGTEPSEVRTMTVVGIRQDDARHTLVLAPEGAGLRQALKNLPGPAQHVRGDRVDVVVGEGSDPVRRLATPNARRNRQFAGAAATAVQLALAAIAGVIAYQLRSGTRDPEGTA